MLDTHFRDKQLVSCGYGPQCSFAAGPFSSNRNETERNIRTLTFVSSTSLRSHFKPESNLHVNSICLDHVRCRSHSGNALVREAGIVMRAKSFAVLNNVKGLAALWHFQDIFDSDTAQRLDLCTNETIKCLLSDKPHCSVYILHKLPLIKR